jgi:hypothetical protein
MAALITERRRRASSWKHKQFTLKSGTKSFYGGAACIERASGKVVPGTPGPSGTLVFIGIFDETVDATLADQVVNIDLLREVNVEWLDNDAGTPVVATDVGGGCYLLDDHTVTGAPAVDAFAGTVWAVDATKGVAVERSQSTDDKLPNAPAIAFAANASAPAAIQSGAVYDVPVTAGASTITLPAAAPDGTLAFFTADGTKNGHTVQYLDATGATAITTALTASKRHLVEVIKRGGKWFANAYVSP